MLLVLSRAPQRKKKKSKNIKHTFVSETTSNMAALEMGPRPMLLLKEILEHCPDIAVISENVHRQWFKDALSVCGYSQAASLGRADATTTTKMGMWGDGISMHVRDAANITVVSTHPFRFTGAKQIALIAVMQLHDVDNHTIVVAATHLKSGTKPKDEAQRATQAQELAEAIHVKAKRVRAAAAFIVGDLNAAIHHTHAVGEPAAIKQLTSATDEEFKVVLPRSTSTIGSEEWLCDAWTSNKSRNIAGRLEEASEGAPPKPKKAKIIREDKTAANDWQLVHYESYQRWIRPDLRESAKRLATPELILSPPQGGPNAHAGMAIHCTDHTPTLVTYKAGLKILGINILAPGLDDEILGNVPPTYASPQIEKKCIEDARTAPTTTITYQDGSKPDTKAKVSPYTLHKEQNSYKLLTTAMQQAWVESLQQQATAAGKTVADIVHERTRKNTPAQTWP